MSAATAMRQHLSVCHSTLHYTLCQSNKSVFHAVEWCVLTVSVLVMPNIQHLPDKVSGAFRRDV